MSFLSGLGKALKFGAKIGTSFLPGVGPIAGKVLDAVGTGGDMLSTVGRVSGDAAKGVQDQRNLENTNAQGYDRNKLARSGQQIDQNTARDTAALRRAELLNTMGIDRAKLGISAPMDRAKQAAYGDALKNVQDVNIGFHPNTGALPQFNVTGGIRPSMFGENARAAGGELGRQALMALMTKSDVPAMPDVPDVSPLVDVPELTPPQGSGVLEKTLGGVGLGGNILGGIGDVLAKRKQQQSKGVPPPVPTMGMTDPNVFKKVQFG